MNTHRIRTAGQRGFTLIELMITVAIVSVLAAIAYPSYAEYMDRSRRSEAQGILMESAQWMERFYAENFRYDQNTAGVDVDELFGARFGQSPRTGAAAYNIAVQSSSQTAFVVRATRAASGPMASDECGNFELTSTGAKRLDSNTWALERCWR